MSGQPSVCVLVPAYNSAATLAETIESILKQTYRDIRVTVVNNASTDATGRIAQSFAEKDSRLRVVTFDQCVGYAQNWTRCIELAEGDYSCLFFADDVYREDIIEKEVAALEARPEAGGVLTNSYVIDDEGRLRSERRLPAEIFERYGGVLHYPEALSLLFKHASFFMTPSFMARTALFKSALVFDASYVEAADVDGFLRFLQKSPLLFLAEPLIYNRLGLHGHSLKALHKKVTALDLFNVLDRHLAAGASALLSREDRDNYAYLRFKDHVRCAVNGLLQGDRALARSMARNVFSPAWRLCLGRPGRALIYGVGLACWLLSFAPLPDSFKSALFKVRFEYKKP